jgi:hypothetical protein
MVVDPVHLLSISHTATLIEALKLQGKVRPTDLKTNDPARLQQSEKLSTDSMAEIIQLLNLPKNKFYVIRLLSYFDLMAILRSFKKHEKGKLVNGLHLFEKDTLLKLMSFLPKKLLVKLLLELFPLEAIIRRLPTRELMNILKAPRLNERALIKILAYLPTHILQRLVGFILEKPMELFGKGELLSVLQNMDKKKMMDGFLRLPPRILQGIVYFLVKQDPELLERMSTGFMFKMFQEVPKGDIVQSFWAMPHEIILDMLSYLPDTALQLVADQINTTPFESYLLASQTGLLASLGQDMSMV